MKNSMIMLLLFVAGNGVAAQTTDEWIRQKETQQKYLLAQVAAFKTYAGYAAQGYSIAANGLKTIKDVKRGDFNIHENFFQSLSSVNPQIKKYAKVASIIAMQISIAKVVRKTISEFKNAKQLTDAEVNYLQQVFNHVLIECADDLDKLMAIITDGAQQMKDDERIKRIDQLHAVMQGKQVFVQSFSHSAKGLTVQRRNEQYDIRIQKKLNGLQ